MKEIAVLVNNKPGVLAEITELLGKRRINIEQITAEAIGTSGIIHMVVDQYDLALQALRDTGFRAMTEDCILLKLLDKPGALAGIALRFKEARINIRSIHIVSRQEGTSIVAVSTERTAEALNLVKDCLIKEHKP